MKARNDCEIACDCVKRANVVLHVGLWKEIFARKHTATHKPTPAQPTHMCHDDTHTHIHTRINRLWSPLAYGLGGNNLLCRMKASPSHDCPICDQPRSSTAKGPDGSVNRVFRQAEHSGDHMMTPRKSQTSSLSRNEI